MLNRGWIWLVWIGLIALATWLRVGGITERPIHADEATGAKIAAQRLEGVGYAFNPKHFHGPWLSLSTVPIAQVRNETTWQELSLGTLRSNSALAGILLVLTPLLWVRRLGAIPSIVASSLLATSPLLVYYSQMYIHESWLALFGFISLAALYRLWTQPSKTNGCLAGLCLGLMFVTKETVAISILSWGATLGLCSLLALKGSIKNTPGPHEYLKPLLCLSFVALVIAAIFYTNGFQHPAGLYEAFRTYFVYETTAGHEKPLGYYLGLLIWPKHTLGIWWSEGLVLLLALLAGLAALQFKQYFKAITFLLIAGTTHLAIYSSISYKNPWLMLLPWAHFCLLAGTAFCDFKRATRPLQVSLLTLLVATLIFQTKQSLYATGRLANDARNPYSYVPTTKDPQRIIQWIEDIKALPSKPALSPAAVIGSGYWPLPWYLRDHPEVGYWPQIAPMLQDFPLVFAMPEQESACDQLLGDTHEKFPRSLRTNVTVTLYLRNDIWQTWSEQATP